MKKYFYNHLIETSLLSLELGDMVLTKQERKHLIDLAHGQLHHVIVDAILSELSQADQKRFLSHVARDEHDKVWELLNEKVEHVEEKIKKAAEALKKQLHKDIAETKKK